MKYIRILIFVILFIAICIMTGFLYARATSRVFRFTPIVITNPPHATQDESTPAHTEPILSQHASHKEISTTTHTTTISDSITNTFHFTVLADSEDYDTTTGHNDVLQHILSQSSKHSPDFVIFTGDLITMPEPSASRLRELKKLINTYYKKYYIAFGKHDLECGARCVSTWQENFFDTTQTAAARQPLYHSFDHYNAHFVLLSSDYPLKHGIDDAQLLWLENDLRTTDKKNIIVVSHVPPVNFFKESAKKCHDMTCDETRRLRLVSILEKYHVDLVLSGHEHAFDHKIINGIDYILSGNIGNGKRYKNSTWQNIYLHVTVDENTLTVTAYDENANPIRTIAIPS